MDREASQTQPSTQIDERVAAAVVPALNLNPSNPSDPLFGLPLHEDLVSARRIADFFSAPANPLFQGGMERETFLNQLPTEETPRAWFSPENNSSVSSARENTLRSTTPPLNANSELESAPSETDLTSSAVPKSKGKEPSDPNRIQRSTEHLTKESLARLNQETPPEERLFDQRSIDSDDQYRRPLTGGGLLASLRPKPPLRSSTTTSEILNEGDSARYFAPNPSPEAGLQGSLSDDDLVRYF